jgi:hypothetical protein
MYIFSSIADGAPEKCGSTYSFRNGAFQKHLIIDNIPKRMIFCDIKHRTKSTQKAVWGKTQATELHSLHFSALSKQISFVPKSRNTSSPICIFKLTLQP